MQPSKPRGDPPKPDQGLKLSRQCAKRDAGIGA
jgi:hypothetical protein